MIKFIYIVLLVVLANTAKAQAVLFFQKSDTVKIDSRSGGKSLDSLADYYAGTVVLNPGSFTNSIFGKYNNDYEHSLEHLSTPFRIRKNTNFLFSAAPHVGFMYSFGSKGIQVLNLDYQQFLSKKFGFNLNLSRNSMGEMMQNGAHTFSEFDFKTRYLGKRYKNYNQLYLQKSAMNQNGGLDSSASVLEFPINFLTVNKRNTDGSLSAKSNLINFSLEAEHYFNFLKDSIKDFGLLISQKWSISNRTYTEKGSLDTIYSQINIDSSETRDQFQFAKIDNYGGLYLKNQQLFAQVSVNYAYWDYQNLALHQDTSELGLNAVLNYKLRDFTLRNKSYFNLTGAKGEKWNQFSFVLNKSKYHFSASANYAEKLPDLFQRKYFANNHLWKTIALSTQTTSSLVADFSLKRKQELSAHFSYTNYANYYFLVDSTWRNDTLKSLNNIHLNVRSSFRFKSLLIQPCVMLNQFSKGLDFLPKVDFRTRLAFQKKVFKSKKLDFIAAVDFTYISSKRLLTYSNSLDVFMLTNSNQFTDKNRYKLDFFTGIQVATFRFYVKAENINYIWDKSDSYVIQDVPITPFYLRIGLTWDFFN